MVSSNPAPAVATSQPSSGSETRVEVLVYSVTSFLSAFLLFQVQLIVCKYILPWFGGSAAVWTTSLLVDPAARWLCLLSSGVPEASSKGSGSPAPGTPGIRRAPSSSPLPDMAIRGHARHFLETGQ